MEVTALVENGPRSDAALMRVVSELFMEPRLWTVRSCPVSVLSSGQIFHSRRSFSNAPGRYLDECRRFDDPVAVVLEEKWRERWR